MDSLTSVFPRMPFSGASGTSSPPPIPRSTLLNNRPKGRDDDSSRLHSNHLLKAMSKAIDQFDQAVEGFLRSHQITQVDFDALGRILELLDAPLNQREHDSLLTQEIHAYLQSLGSPIVEIRSKVKTDYVVYWFGLLYQSIKPWLSDFRVYMAYPEYLN